MRLMANIRQMREQIALTLICFIIINYVTFAALQNSKIRVR